MTYVSMMGRKRRVEVFEPGTRKGCPYISCRNIRPEYVGAMACPGWGASSCVEHTYSKQKSFAYTIRTYLLDVAIFTVYNTCMLI